MAVTYPLTGRRRRLYDVVLASWVLFWLVVGTATAVQIWRLTRLSETVVESGQALDRAGSALQQLGSVPVIGRAPRQLGDQVRLTAGQIQEREASSGDTIRRLSVLLGLSIVVLPITAVVGWQVPLRMALSRERRTIESALAGAGDDPLLEKFLAHCAAQTLPPYDTLRRVTDDPWRDLQRRSYRHLANAELTRLGVAKRTRPTPTASSSGGSQAKPALPS